MPLAEALFRVKGELRLINRALDVGDNQKVLIHRISLKELLERLRHSLALSTRESTIDNILLSASKEIMRLADTTLDNASGYLSSCLLSQ